MDPHDIIVALASILVVLMLYAVTKKQGQENFANPIITEALRPFSYFNPYTRGDAAYYYRAPVRYGRLNRWSSRPSRYYNGRPFRYWTRYIAPSYYPTGGAYAYDLKEWYNPYDYTNDPFGELCHARIDISDAFGPYTAGVMGKQAWLDFGTRNGFNKVYLPRDSVTNDHAIIEYVGQCNRAAQEPPPKDRYQVHRPQPQFY